MAKATHYGHCQCCGALQKLPSGLLSNHGYTVEHGWFEGVCYGARHLPFEQSKDLIEGLIKRAQERAQELRKEADEYLANPSANGIKRHVYVKNDRYGSGNYQWIEDNIFKVTKYYDDSNDSYIVFYWDEKHSFGFGPDRAAEYQHFENLADAVKHERGQWYNFLLKKAAETDNYITWQQERIKNWKPAELEEIKKAIA